MDTRLNQKAPEMVGRALPPDGISLKEVLELLLGFLRRQLPIFLFVLSCAIGAGLLYLFTTPPRFTAHAMLVIDSSKMRVLQQQAPLSDVPLDTAQVET